MATATYLVNRKKYSRPQAVLFANNPGTLSVVNPGTENEDTFYVPDGIEVLGDQANAAFTDSRFITLSDDNRDRMDFSVQRIEKRERMINGRMRSFHIADKLSLSLNWNMLPSRSAVAFPGYNPITGKSALGRNDFYTTDGGAGGVELLDWYENNPGSFWVYLAYDKYNSFGSISSGANSPEIYSNLPKYNQVVEMFFADFSYSVVKRSSSTFDFWNVSLSLEEV